MKKTVKVGNVVIGDGKHIPIQSMCNIPFSRFEELKEQSLALQNAGCEILRYAFPDKSAAEGFSKIKETLDINVKYFPILFIFPSLSHLQNICGEGSFSSGMISPFL